MEEITQDELTAQVEALPIEVVRHVLWHVGDVVLGANGGHFVAALLTTIGRADKEDRLKLSLVFPEYVSGFVGARREATHDLMRIRVKEAFPLAGVVDATRTLALSFSEATR